MSQPRHYPRSRVQGKYLEPNFLQGRFLMRVLSFLFFFFFQMEGFLCIGKWLTDPSAASNPTIPRSTGCNRCKAAGRAWKLFCTLRVLYNPFSHQAGTEFWCEGLCLVRATVLGKEIFFVTRKGSFWCCFGGFSFFL